MFDDCVNKDGKWKDVFDNSSEIQKRKMVGYGKFRLELGFLNLFCWIEADSVCIIILILVGLFCFQRENFL